MVLSQIPYSSLNHHYKVLPHYRVCPSLVEEPTCYEEKIEKWQLHVNYNYWDKEFKFLFPALEGCNYIHYIPFE